MLLLIYSHLAHSLDGLFAALHLQSLLHLGLLLGLNLSSGLNQALSCNAEGSGLAGELFANIDMGGNGLRSDGLQGSTKELVKLKAVSRAANGEDAGDHDRLD